MPLLPTMSTDSFFNLVESLPAATPRSDAHDTTQGGRGSTMQRQSSGPLRIGSMINAWDEETAIAPHGHIPSLRLNSSALQVKLCPALWRPTPGTPCCLASDFRTGRSLLLSLLLEAPTMLPWLSQKVLWLQNNSMLMDPHNLQSVGLAGSSLRLPSSFASPDGYAHFIRDATHATRMHAPGLKTMSGTVPRMQVGGEQSSDDTRYCSIQQRFTASPFEVSTPLFFHTCHSVQVVTNSDPGTGGMDFENNRTFTVRCAGIGHSRS